MPLSEEDRCIVDAFREYIEDSLTADDRYGAAERIEADDDSMLATRFEVGAACRLEMAVLPADRVIRVGFITSDRSMCEEIRQGSGEDEEEGEGEAAAADETVDDLVRAGFRGAGLDWPDPPVEPYPEGDQEFGFATPFGFYDLDDLDTDATRNQALRMLEAYLIAFGSVMDIDEDE